MDNLLITVTGAEAEVFLKSFFDANVGNFKKVSPDKWEGCIKNKNFEIERFKDQSLNYDAFVSFKLL